MGGRLPVEGVTPGSLRGHSPALACRMDLFALELCAARNPALSRLWATTPDPGAAAPHRPGRYMPGMPGLSTAAGAFFVPSRRISCRVDLPW
jgi:hypothetical protein